MSPRALRTLSMFGLLLLPACAAEPTVDLDAEREAIRDLDRQWVEAFANQDMAFLTGIYTAEGAVMPPNAPAATGEEIEAQWRELLELGMSLTFEPQRIEVSDDASMAYDIGTYSMSYEGPDGPVSDEGKYLVVWEKVNGEWKVAADMFNSNLPPSM